MRWFPGSCSNNFWWLELFSLSFGELDFDNFIVVTMSRKRNMYIDSINGSRRRAIAKGTLNLREINIETPFQ